jgi:hypothetical protein
MKGLIRASSTAIRFGYKGVYQKYEVENGSGKYAGYLSII